MDTYTDTLDYWHWVYYITREWIYPNRVTVEYPNPDGSTDVRDEKLTARGGIAKVIGFAIILSTFGDHGTDIRPSAATLARRATMTKRTAGHYRQVCLALGLFKDTGKVDKYRIPVLEISMPQNAGGPKQSGALLDRKPDRFKCDYIGCNVATWHEHRPEEPSTRERAEADSEDMPPKRTRELAAATARRAWDD
jgi:hypothetical protein